MVMVWSEPEIKYLVADVLINWVVDRGLNSRATLNVNITTDSRLECLYRARKSYY